MWSVCIRKLNCRKVAFFMRKGADCLSKWVGESERQLRLLFDQAYSMRPSIIFFDELDGLAPVRSTRQDQIHSSIVSTLLALMDGLDQRGEVVVVGATNRLDALDPALRRPGRFDRELAFSLPDRKSRMDILKIHTKAWEPPLEDDVLHTVGRFWDQLIGSLREKSCRSPNPGWGGAAQIRKLFVVLWGGGQGKFFAQLLIMHKQENILGFG